jgi:lipoprotein signal peptidase
MACALTVIAVDQFTKQWATSAGQSALNEPGTNPGLSLGVASSSLLFTAGAAVAGVVVLTLATAWTLHHRPERAWLAGLALGGAASNLLDRALRCGVIDFIPLGVIVANLADVAVMVGLISMVAMASRSPDAHPDENEEVTT